MTIKEIEYTIKILLNIAIPHYAKEFKIQGNHADNNEVKIVFNHLEKNEILTLLSGKYSMNAIKSHVNDYDVPIILSTETAFASINENTLFINADIITLPFYLLSRKEALESETRDSRGRFSYQVSLSHKYHLIGIPIVDEYALSLRNYLKKMSSHIQETGVQGKVIPTHDIDTGRRFNGFYQSWKSLIGGDLILRKSIKCFFQSLKQYLYSFNNPDKDPEIMGIWELMKLSQGKGLVSEFYFMGNTQMLSNYHYDIFYPSIRRLFPILKSHGMTIGFHGDIGTSEDERKFLEQKQALETSSGLKIHIGRQHYLMFNELETPSIWEKCGITRDLSLGYFDREGFMCGTCHPYPLYDLANDRESDVIEQPLIVMERTLIDYRGLTMYDALNNIRRLYRICMNVEGNFVILWHNASVHREEKEWYENVYKKFINELN